MPQYPSIAVLFPLIILVILRASSMSRENSLTETFNNRAWLFPNDMEDVPEVGAFSLIHSFNNSLLLCSYLGMSTLYFQQYVSKPTIREIPIVLDAGMVFLLAFWIFLPIFEVSEYFQISYENESVPLPNSFVIHIWGTLVTAGLITASAYYRTIGPAPPRSTGFIEQFLSVYPYIINNATSAAIAFIILMFVAIIHLYTAYKFFGNLESELIGPTNEYWGIE